MLPLFGRESVEKDLFLPHLKSQSLHQPLKYFSKYLMQQELLKQLKSHQGQLFLDLFYKATTFFCWISEVQFMFGLEKVHHRKKRKWDCKLQLIIFQRRNYLLLHLFLDYLKEAKTVNFIPTFLDQIDKFDLINGIKGI